jgi:hypothetical protein
LAKYCAAHPAAVRPKIRPEVESAAACGVVEISGVPVSPEVLFISFICAGVKSRVDMALPIHALLFMPPRLTGGPVCVSTTLVVDASV